MFLPKVTSPSSIGQQMSFIAKRRESVESARDIPKTDKNFTMISAGNRHSLGLLEDGTFLIAEEHKIR